MISGAATGTTSLVEDGESGTWDDPLVPDQYGAALAAYAADPQLRALIENYCLFAPRVVWMPCDFFALRSTILFDWVAV